VPTRAVVFDLYDTLIRVDPDARTAHQAALAARLGADPVAFARAWAATSLASNRGELTTVERVHEVQALLGIADAETGAADGVAEAVAAEEHAFLARETRVAPGATDLLDALRASGIRTGILSNCSPSVEATLAASGLRPRADAVLLSCDLGLVKPERAIFEAALAALEVAADELVYVADGQSGELEAADALGARTIRVTWSVADGTQPDASATLTGMTDVGEALGVGVAAGRR
jgi:putative hydrolase of the HAD superfamily